ncbi:MAG: hypothetical protein LC751_11450 [Actinobacteria bacterium]|nr:hypothetical protein [Actinomycetota bacterium]MCA1739687.1 hypothetical protein [Actinomycetota bacterium]
MPIDKEKFKIAANEAAEKELRKGMWRVYEDYEVKGTEEGNPYVVRAPGVMPEHEYYPLVSYTSLFLNLARLANEGEITQDVWRNWIKSYGVLGLERDDMVRYFIKRHRELGNSLDELSREIDWMDRGERDWDSWLYSANLGGGSRESYRNFVKEVRKAKKLLQLYEAATHPNGPDMRIIKWYFDQEGIGDWIGTPKTAKRWALSWVGYIVQETIAVHCYPALYQVGDKISQGWGFHTLLGAMYLQMAWLLASTEQVRCKWCGDIISFEQP